MGTEPDTKENLPASGTLLEAAPAEPCTPPEPAGPTVIPTATSFRVVLADPPWCYRNYRRSEHGAASASYETMKPEEIKAIPVQRWVDRDSVLLLWATWPQLDVAMDVLRAWGFAYVSGIPWIKTVPSSGEIRCGIGIWTQSTSEFVLIGKRGHPARKEDRPHVRGLLVGDDEVFYAPTGAHSLKPLGIQEWAERTLDGPYLELFARRPRPGWTSWGRESGYVLSAEGCTGSGVATSWEPPRRRNRCRKCGLEGHNARSCRGPEGTRS